jgi:uncharacterized peroxidase-related enzyme
MPRIPALDPQTAPEAAKPYLDGFQKKIGRVPNIFKTMAGAPTLLEVYTAFSGAMAKTSLPATLREQIALACAAETHCDYCASAHTAIGKGAGLTDAQATAALDGRADNPRSQAAINLARDLIRHPQTFTDAQYQALKTAGFNDQEIMEMVAVISLNLFTNFFNHVADTAIDFEPVIKTAQAA